MARKASRPGIVDLHVGDRIRERRTLLGLTQTDVADAMGLSFQQIQKYESGGNRISAGRLFQIACLLDVDIDYFFEDLVAEDGETGTPIAYDPSLMREALAFVRAYNAIEDEDVRKGIFELTKALSE